MAGVASIGSALNFREMKAFFHPQSAEIRDGTQRLRYSLNRSGALDV
jgi:hypothetical protein